MNIFLELFMCFVTVVLIALVVFYLKTVSKDHDAVFNQNKELVDYLDFIEPCWRHHIKTYKEFSQTCVHCKKPFYIPDDQKEIGWTYCPTCHWNLSQENYALERS